MTFEYSSNRYRLAVNARFLTQTVTGVQRFAINISREIKKILPETLFLSPPGIINQQLANELGALIVGSRNCSRSKRLRFAADFIWEQFELPCYLARKNYPRLLNLANLAPYVYGNNLLVVHDLAFRLYPEYFSRAFALYYNFLIPRLAHRARHIVTVSERSRNDICHHLSISPAKVSVIYNAAQIEAVPEDSVSPYPWPYLLSVGTMEPRKNLERLIAAYQRVKSQSLRLVLVGGHQSGVFKKVKDRECCAGQFANPRDDRIIFTGFVSDRELVNLYRHALGFCYPSLYEGFGLPPLEAQVNGCPVLVSNRASLPEVFGESALYCDPENLDDMVEKLQRLIDDAKLRKRLQTAGDLNCRRFDWRQSAEKIVNISLERRLI